MHLNREFLHVLCALVGVCRKELALLDVAQLQKLVKLIFLKLARWIVR